MIDWICVVWLLGMAAFLTWIVIAPEDREHD